MPSNQTNSEKKKALLGLLIFAVITAIMWQFTAGRYVLYPFTILGTWFHEMAHGLTAMLLGGSFHQLEIYSNGSGLAMHSGSLLFGSVGSAIVAAAGPIGPTVAGSLFILSSQNQKTAKVALIILGLLLVISPVIWIRSIFGFLIILGFGLATLIIAFQGKKQLRSFAVQFLGVQAILSLYLSVGYLFSRGAVVGGRTYLSDTAVIQEHLFLPYWFWAAIILVVSLIMVIYSILTVYKK